MFQKSVSLVFFDIQIYAADAIQKIPYLPHGWKAIF